MNRASEVTIKRTNEDGSVTVEKVPAYEQEDLWRIHQGVPLKHLNIVRALVAWRTERGLTAWEAAKSIKVEPRHWRAWERGTSEVPDHVLDLIFPSGQTDADAK